MMTDEIGFGLCDEISDLRHCRISLEEALVLDWLHKRFVTYFQTTDLLNWGAPLLYNKCLSI